eukprot:gnl/TRDRNA2_/TRDRNA2_80964_c0_seq1.p1 gnl/TRDRNA2_/TRDRNA2_80964_c0~~gnl/TRDRNA2_/TRDRNA2_80964_c0_seq1.p1  ORF type:complete len:205 (+),score=27.93 gnl/TRDRNA2_/TRDRNA2_80964_c0_seq1:43-615(+)
MEAKQPPALIVFDLDACCWSPEMYELWGGGSPFTQLSTEPNNQLEDRRGTRVRLLADVAQCFAELHRRAAKGEPLLTGIASRCDEPSWGEECLGKFYVAPGVTMIDVVSDKKLCRIHKGSKQTHFEELHRATNIPYERMAFFDDDPYNIRDVSSLGVHCFHTPIGVTKELFDKGVAAALAGGAGKTRASR